MAIVKKRRPAVVKVKENVEATTPVVEDVNVEATNVEEVKEVKPTVKKTTTKKVVKKPEPEVEETEEEVEVETNEVEETEVKPTVKKATTVSKNQTKKSESVKGNKTMGTNTKKATTTAKKESDSIFGKSIKLNIAKEKSGIVEAGTLKRDDLIAMMKDKLENKFNFAGIVKAVKDEDGDVIDHKATALSLEDVSKMIKVFESIVGEALDMSNIVHLCGKNFNRRKVKARVYNPPIGNSGATLELPHYKMVYMTKTSEKLTGSIDDEGNFVAENGTVYTAKDLERLDAEFFGEE